MPPGYSSQQKSAISQFQNFTQADRNSAVKFLKNYGWDPEAAVNGFFSNGSGTANNPGVKSSLSKIFDKYREDANSPDTAGMEQTMKYLGDIDVSVEGLDFLVVSEIIQAPSMGEMSRQGFVDGWAALQCDTLEKQKQYIQQVKQSLPSNKAAFAKVYSYTFQLAKTGNQKTLPLDHACAYWEVVFNSPLSAVRWTSPSSPWSEWWVEFLTTQWKRAINKDHWNQTLKFAQLTLEDESLSFWNEESSWPSIIDEFVEWVKKDKRGGGENGDAMEE
ncbi:DUF298-domain-containing protein [Aaosphaeria arxii CBS 175.79]|uniref:Defective in cullin neddylation protein n=1 Tax=Aaosphaeria arxii CBS 175.79 TaxID=1450172 RepID=A0A6A5XGG9_9PLEO|nr:DUF298-domain-containing protein [Aaosphaeria arxii CBS 175.79]KAF2011464.1 DUF298-domain-containing protein [Aaosphaeria arxii CBS 175.79]